ncbi:sodium:solute symporter [Gammaproteobacteria bacterium 45_16_T64]|nr:sodium:solute symporter [Gammaproteobacteria bacterium 45_16_T64]
MKLDPVDLWVLGLYFGVILFLGFYFSRKNTNTEEYFVGGRSFPGWAIGLSLVGTSISSITFLAYPGDAYKTAWLRFLPNLMLPVALIIAAYFFLPIFRRKKTTSAYEFLEDRFGPSVRVYGAVAFMIAQLVRLSTILYLLALLVHELTGLDHVTCIVLSGMFVSIYTIIGGIDAVIWTDVLQTFVLVAGGVMCLYVIIDLLPNGFSDVFSIAETHGKLAFAELKDGELSAVSWDLSLLNKTGSMMLILGVTSWLTEYSSNQNTVQRYCAAKSEEEARKGMLICGLSSLPIWAFYMFLGTALFAFYQVFPSSEAAMMLSGEQKAEQILPYFVLSELPPGLVGLVLAAALAAAMSSLDSSINAISTVSIVDIYRRHLQPNKADKHYLRVAWFVAVVVSCFMIAGAIYINQAETKTLQDTATILASLLGGGLLGLYLIGFFSKKGGVKSAWAGIAVTLIFTAWTISDKNGWLPEFMSMPFDAYYATLIGNVIMFVVIYFTASFVFDKPDNKVA